MTDPRAATDGALPIDTVLPRILAALQEGRNLVVTAPPGAGKTTRVPIAWLTREHAQGEMVILQPRRLAARAAAAHVARLLDEPVGERCGYQVRFDTRVSPRTRIRFVTEGLFNRRLLDDPTLGDVSVVVLDEFHERHLDTELALVLARRLQQGPRPDLRIVAMSATMDAGPVADLLQAESIACEGRSFPVHIEHEVGRGNRSLPSAIATAFRGLLDTGLEGDILTFVPGRREIRQTMEACSALAQAADIEVSPLHGQLSPQAQDAAITPGTRRKLIVSTNVAETSVTVEGVVAVIDSGLARIAAHDPWTGLATLELRKIAQASADQRAGRAGRVRPGRCIRLYARHDFDRRPAHESPEIARLDLSTLLLRLHGAGIDDPAQIHWLDPPPAPALATAEALLGRLGAVADGRLTSSGRQMLQFPVHPRHARVLVEAQRLGIAELAAGAVALLEEREIRRTRTPGTRSALADVLSNLEDLRRWQQEGDEAGRALGLDIGACKHATRVRKQLLGLLDRDVSAPEDPDSALCMALLAGYPDRVARAQGDRSGMMALALAGGGRALLSEQSVVAGASLLVALRARKHREGTRGPKTVVDSAAAIEPEWLLELFPEHIEEHLEVQFDPERKRVRAVAEVRYLGVLLDAAELQKRPPEATRILFQSALSAGPAHYMEDPEALDHLVARTEFLATQVPDVQPLDSTRIEAVLWQMCEQADSFEDLKRADLVAQLEGQLEPRVTDLLRRLAPARITLPSGRSLRVHYEQGRDPWVASRLQDFFGSRQGPTLAEGEIPLVLHLLAPNRRAVQVTRDLAGFWSRHYPQLRRTLMRRYPKHDWPEDPLTAKPPPPGRTRRKRSPTRRR